MPSSPESEGREQAVEQAPADSGAHEGNGQRAQEVEDLRQRVEQLDDRYKRALADLDNYRKRSGREVERQVAERSERMAREWLEVVDNLERALVLTTPENPVAEGLRAVLEQLEALLDRQGITRVGEPGERFDPERHEAIGVHETNEVPDQTVVDVARSGYSMGDRVLRPAQVIVSRSGQRAA
ncbi:MAG: nucleotide exchange factor GrpE [Thermoleophilaceae bacterium]